MLPESRGATRLGRYDCLKLEVTPGRQWSVPSAALTPRRKDQVLVVTGRSGVDDTAEGAGVGSCWEERETEPLVLEQVAHHGSTCKRPSTHW